MNPKILLACSVFFLISCASNQTGTRSVESRGVGDFTFISTLNIMSELEPCGCSTRQLGGMGRIANVIQKWKEDGSSNKNAIHISAGRTFVPLQVEEFKRAKDHFAQKAKYVVQGLNRLGVQVVFPSIEDFSIGLEKIQEIRKESKFSFVSANIVDKRSKKPIFEPFKIFKNNGRSVLVTRLSAWAIPTEWDIDLNVTVADPVASLKSIIDENKEVDAVVLLSELSSSDQYELAKMFPKIRLFIGQSGNKYHSRVLQGDPNNLFVNFRERGWEIARVQIEVGDENAPYFSAENAADLIQEREWRTKRIDELTQKIKKEKKAKVVQGYKDLISDFRVYLSTTEKIPRKEAPGQLKYSSTVVATEKQFDEPKNELHQFVEKYKTEMVDRVTASESE